MANVPDAGLGTHTVLCELIVWLSPFQCRLCFHGETYSIGLETLQRQAETWQGAGGLLNLVASFLFVLIWKWNCCGHLEMLRELYWRVGDCTFPVKHLRHYPKLCSVPGWWRKWPVNRTLFFYRQDISWMNIFVLLYPERLWMEEKTFCNAFPFHIVFDESVKDPFSL